MNDDELREIFATTRTIAVLGLHDDPTKAARYVPDYLHEHGFRILGVNPKLAGQDYGGVPIVASLTEIDEPVDMVDVFRASRWLPQHQPEVLAIQPRPAVVWLQLGVVDPAFSAALRDADITVVENRCALAEHRRLGLG